MIDREREVEINRAGKERVKKLWLQKVRECDI